MIRHRRGSGVLTLALFLALWTVTTQMKGANHVLELDGYGDYVSLSPAFRPSTSEFTVEAWVRWKSFNSFSKVFTVGDGGQFLSLGNDARGGRSLRVKLFGESHQVAEQRGSLILGRWMHLAITVGPTRAEVFLNGTSIEVFQKPPGNPGSPGDSPSLIGGAFLGLDEYFHGQIDEVRIWDRVRSRDQILQAMFRSMSGSEPSLVGLWDFESAPWVQGSQSITSLEPRFHGDAKLVESELPEANGTTRVAAVRGRVTNALGEPLPQCRIQLRHGALVEEETESGPDGKFEFWVRPAPQERQLIARSQGFNTHHSPLILEGGKGSDIRNSPGAGGRALRPAVDDGRRNPAVRRGDAHVSNRERPTSGAGGSDHSQRQARHL